jgi:hypothetical protein
MTTEFSTAAFRCGHSMIQGSGQMELETFLRNNYFNLTHYASNNGLGMEQTIMGLIYQAAQANDEYIKC